MAICNCHGCRFVLPELLDLLERASHVIDGDTTGLGTFYAQEPSGFSDILRMTIKQVEGEYEMK